MGSGQEQEEACRSLQSTLAKKEVPKQVLLAKMTRAGAPVPMCPQRKGGFEG